MPEGSQNTGHAILDGLYELHDTVGTGGFAKVKVATHIQTGLKVRQLTEHNISISVVVDTFAHHNASNYFLLNFLNVSI